MPAADLFVQALLGVVGPDLPPDLFGEGGECGQVGPGVLEVFGHLRKLLGECLQDAVILSVNSFRVGLVIHGM